ncbi:hypothetical protein MTQ16_00735 [Corynebacterium bovis]
MVGSDDHPLRRHARVLRAETDAEVGEHPGVDAVADRADDDVRRLDVPVEHRRGERVQVVQGSGDGAEQRHRLVDGERTALLLPAADEGREVRPVDVLHDEVGDVVPRLPRVVHGDDRGVVDAREETDLLAEPLQAHVPADAVAGEDLHGHPPGGDVVGWVRGGVSSRR